MPALARVDAEGWADVMAGAPSTACCKLRVLAEIRHVGSKEAVVGRRLGVETNLAPRKLCDISRAVASPPQ